MATIKCDPECGRGCTLAQYNYVTRQAKALHKQLGSSWLIKVWDNLGWHFHVMSKNKCIYVTDRRSALGSPLKRGSAMRYYAYISDVPGETYVSYDGYGSTPKEAIESAASKLRAKMSQLELAIKDARAIVRQF